MTPGPVSAVEARSDTALYFRYLHSLL